MLDNNILLMQLYSIKTVVQIERVKLNIRFPGQLSFQFKNNHLYQDLPRMYQLANGECAVDESVALQVQSVYNSIEDTYSQVLVDLIISINTATGKISAGSITFNAIQNNTLTLPLKRCSDKAAQVTINVNFARIEKIKDVQEEVVVVTTTKQKSESRLLANYKSRDKRSIEDLRPPVMVTHTENRRETERNSSKDSRNLLASRIGKVGGNVDTRYKQMQQNYERKIKQLIKEREEAESQLQTVRQKWKLSERREKQIQNSFKDVKDALEKRRIKMTDLQAKLLQSQKVIQDYERKTKMLQQQLKQQLDKIEDITSKYAILEKKLESKEQSTTQTERRLSQKLQQLQSQHNKTVNQYNLLLQKMEIQEKANQTIFKNKEKLHLEEKAKLKEQFEKSEKLIKKLQDQNDQLSTKCTVFVSNEKSLILKIGQLESDYELLKGSDESKRLQLQKEDIVKKDLIRQLEEFKNLQGDKAALKKKINEGSQEQIKMKEKIDKLAIQNQQLKENFKKNEKLLEQYKRQKKTLTTRCSDLDKIQSNQQKQVARLLAQNNNLSSKNTYLNQRLNDLKTKSEQQSNSHTQIEGQLQSRINSLLQSKQYLEADIEDLKWSLQKSDESIRECEKKLKERADQILKYQEETLKLQKEKDDLTLKLEQANTIIQTLKSEIADLRRKEQEQLDTLKDRDRKIYQHLKKISELEQEHFIASSKLNNNIEDFKDNLTHKESTIEQLTTQLTLKHTKLLQIQNSLEKLEQDNQQQARELKLLTISLEQSERSLKLEKERNDQLKKSNQALKKLLAETQSKLIQKESELTEQISTLSIQKLTLEKQALNNQNDLDTYKKSVQQLLIVISKEDQMSKIQEIIALPDQTLAKYQLQAIQNRNKYLQAFRSTISELKVEINYLEKQSESKSNSLNAKNEELQETVKKYNQKTLELETNWNKTSDNYGKLIEGLEAQLAQLKTEKEKLDSKHKTLAELYEDQKSQRQALETQLNATKEELKRQEEKNLELRSREISKKGEDESYIHNLKVQLKNELNKYQQTIQKLRKDIQVHLKTIAQKEKAIATSKSNYSQLQQQKGKLEQGMEELLQRYNKLSEEKISADQNLQEAQKNIINLKEDLEKAAIQIQSERQLKKALETQLKQSHQHAQQLSIFKQNLENRLSNITKSSTMSQQEQKAKILSLEESLFNQTKKYNQLFKQLTEKSGELSLKEFLITQLQQKLSDNESTCRQLKRDVQQKRSAINKLNSYVQEQNRKIMGVQKEKTDYSQEKSAVEEELSIKKEKIDELQSEIKDLNNQLQRIRHQLEDSRASEAQLKEERINLQTNLNELRQNLSEARREVQKSNAKQNQVKNKLSLVQDQLKEKQDFYQNFKNKNWEQNQREVLSLKEKAKQLEAKIEVIQEEREDERQNLKNQIEYISHANQELEQLLEEKEEVIERQQAELMEAHARIISLNGELRSCLEAWEKEKATSLPSKRQTAKIEEDMNKFQSFASELDRKTKQILNASAYKVKDQIMAKTSQSLVDLLELVHRSKSRSMSKAEDSQKEDIVKQYDRMREKIEEILKSQRVTTKE